MPYYCTVPRCTSMAGKAKNVSFHQFPRDDELARLWNKILKRGKPYTKYSKVCSLHFRPEDYTMTIVGKTKGQWRTLRKDAIPSCNLPSESPPCQYQRRSSTSVTPLPAAVTPNFMDPQVQHQVAQAIYMQTMLAMQAASFRDADQKESIDLSLRHDESSIPEDVSTTERLPQNKQTPDLEEMLLNHESHKDQIPTATDQINAPSNVPQQELTVETGTSYKCIECTKCFKDPDVFLLHKRTHKQAVSLTNSSQKENINQNLDFKQENALENLRQETLKANPILANLLKPESVPVDGVNGVREHIMTAMALNMQAFIKSLAQRKSYIEGSDDDVENSCDELNGSADTNRLVIDESV